jgi:threonine dehydratase
VTGPGPQAGDARSLPPTFSPADAAHEVALASRRIASYIRETPLEPSPFLSGETGCDVYLKLECVQVTGSFKARGALNTLLSLSDAERAGGVVAASTGNHGLAVAHALALLGIAGEIFLPASVSPAKLEGLRARGARVRLVDEDPGVVETVARRDAERTGRIYVSPYNDPRIIGGQGTVGVELLRQLADVDAVLVPVGGGGLISGIGAYLKEQAPKVRIVGCQPAACPILAESVKAGRLIELPSAPSLSDATVGLVEGDAISFPVCQACVDDWVVVDEPAIRSALRLVLERQSVLIEGAAALPVAALLAARDRWRGARLALVLTGSHIALSTLAEVLRDA